MYILDIIMRHELQRQLVKRLRNENKSYIEIGKIIGLSRHVVRHLNVYEKVKNPKKRGKKPVLRNADKLLIKRRISTLKNDGQKIDSTKLKNACQLDVSTRTIRRYLFNVGMTYRNIPRVIFLTKSHKEKRVEIATKWITSSHDWSKTIFSDEKRFTLDGPDNWMTYIDKKEKKKRERRQCKGGGVMVWLMVMPNGLLSHKIIIGKFGSKEYLDLLQTSIVPICKLNYGVDFFYQSDNSTVHNAKCVQKFMKDSEIKNLEWPAKSPDLNIVEDIWKMLSNDIYDGPQFKNVKELKEKINSTILDFNSRNGDKIKALYLTIHQRLCKVLIGKGNICNL